MMISVFCFITTTKMQVPTPLEKCLLYLAYQADKIQLEELVHKEMMKKMK